MLLDQLNQPIEVGDIVAASRSGTNTLRINTVTKVGDKKVTLDDGAHKFPGTMVVISKQIEYARATWPEFHI